MPKAHPPEFRQRAIDLARAGDKPVAQIAKDLGISESGLRLMSRDITWRALNRFGLTCDVAPAHQGTITAPR